MHRTILEILDFRNAVTSKTGLGVRQGHWKCHRPIERYTYDFLLIFCSNYGSTSCRF